MPDPLPDHEPRELAPEEQLRRRLLGRIAVAGVVIAALLGGLVLVDQFATPLEAPKLATLPPPPALDSKTEGADKPAEAGEAKKEDAPAEAGKEEPRADAKETGKDSKPSLAAEEKTESPPMIGKGEKVPTPQAEVKPTNLKPGASGAPLVVARPVEPAREIPRDSRAPAPVLQSPLRPLSGLTRPAQTPTVADTSKGYVLQMGVFNNVANAEELRARLELAGIPAHVEARVQVGPFTSREEAEAARKKLAALGLDGGFLTSQRK